MSMKYLLPELVTTLFTLGLVSSTMAETPRITDFSHGGAVSWTDNCLTGQYSVQTSTNLTSSNPSNWMSVATSRGTGTNMTLYAPMTSSVPTFIRLLFAPDDFPWGILPISNYWWYNQNGDPAWSFSQSTITRSNTSQQTAINFIDQIPGSFQLQFDLKPLGVQYSDGKGVVLQDSTGIQRSIFINDDQPYVIELSGGIIRDSAGAPPISTNESYHFNINVLSNLVTAEINAVALSDVWTSTPPYWLMFTAQRTGYVVTNVIISPR